MWETQFGFRKKKSTAQALFITRRLQDIAEESGSALVLLFLDWEKAFDKVDQVELVKAIGRLNVPQKITRVLASSYVNPQFKIKDRGGKSDYRKQRTGIRQGCLLSPYLFILLMTVLMHEVHEQTDEIAKSGQITHINFTELLYADDTLVITNNQESMNQILNLIEKVSTGYNMALNRAKCFHVSKNCKPIIKFKDGTREYRGCFCNGLYPSRFSI